MKLLSIGAVYSNIIELLAHSWHTQMATIRKKGKFQWHVQIRRKGYPSVTKTFTGEKDAQEFARQTESDMDRGVYQQKSASASTTIRVLAERYIEEISPGKKNAVEDVRLMNVVIDRFGEYYLSNLKSLMVTEWIDELKKKGKKGSTINHHLSTLSVLVSTAMTKWKYVLPENPCRNVERAPAGKPRDRRLMTGEEDRIIAECMNSRNKWVAAGTKLSIETGMRQGEIFRLRWENIDLEKRVATAYETKNGDNRDIPLSSRAVAILNSLTSDNEGKVFKCTQHGVASSMRYAIKKARAIYLEECKKLDIKPEKGYLENLRPHDLRHEATSRFFEMDLNMMEVASITGHKTLEMLKRYTHLKAANLAKKLG